MARSLALLALVTLLLPLPARAERLPSGALRLRAAPCGPIESNGASLACRLDDSRLPHPTSYFEQHAALVAHDLMHFNQPYTLQQMRDRDTLLLYGPAAGGATSVASGIALFSTVVVGAAHAPAPLRLLFDRRMHLGPALFDGGGMGAGVGGHL
jgi:hypothetical protein